MQEEKLDHAKVGKMFVTSIKFQWVESGERYNSETQKYEKLPAHWEISASLSEQPRQYSNCQNMTIHVEHGIGQKLAEVLLPVITADASQKAQQLADDSKAMLAALGERALKCIENMPEES